MPQILTMPTQRPFTGGEQARELRALVARQLKLPSAAPAAVRRCHRIVVAGGKGGVGRSVIALNLAVALVQQGHAVGLLDGSPNFGNIELLCGLNSYWNLSSVLQGSRQLTDVVQIGPGGVRIVAGAGCLVEPDFDIPASAETVGQLNDFEKSLDWMIVDASGATARMIRRWVAAADDLLILTTPEPTAVAEAYASVKAIAHAGKSRMGLLVNQADSPQQAQQILDHLQHAAQSFLHVDLHRRGYIPRDGAIPLSVNEHQPFVLHQAASPAAQSLKELARRWTRTAADLADERYFDSFFERQRTRAGLIGKH